ncbi:conjugal transfer protein TraL, partial [Escherichia coli]|nr:conjugal transfer protein TraL [Escherichia coli]
PLIKTKFIEKNKDVIAGVVVIQDRKSDAFASDIKNLTEKSLTLKEALESEFFGLMAKSRLKRVFNDIYVQLDSIYNMQHTEA